MLMLSFYPQHISLSPQHSTFLSHLIRPQLMRLCLSSRFRVEEESIFTSASSWFFDVKVIKRSSAVCDTFSSTNNFQWNKFLSFCQTRFQLWRKMFGEAEASFFLLFSFPFFQVSEWASGEISLSPFPFRLKNRVHISNSGTTGQLR